MLHRKLRCNSYIVPSNACPCDLGLMSSSDIIRIDGGDPTPPPPPHQHTCTMTPLAAKNHDTFIIHEQSKLL